MNENFRVPPSKPGPRFSSADLLGAKVDPRSLGQIILQQTAPGQSLDIHGLLSAILKSQKTQNARFAPVPFDFPVWTIQQILPENPNRAYLLIQNVGASDIMVLHDTGPNTPTDNSSAQGQAALTLLQTRAIRIVAGGNYEPLVAPTNPITIFTLSAATNGAIIEGV